MTAGTPPRAPALIVDWGGVLTPPFDQAIAAWAAEERVDPAAFLAALGGMLGPAAAPGSNIFHRVERGELAVPEFEAALAATIRTLDGGHPPAAGLVQRMFAPFTLIPEMVELLGRLRGTGVPVALLSNSWGHAYDRTGWAELFDVVVISREVGMRKPEPEIFAHTARLLGRSPRDCVVLDDLGRNVTAARALGMAAVHHRSVAETTEALTLLLGVAGQAAAG